MYRIFHIVKKKKNLRRLSVVCLLLVAIELFCPIFCESVSFAAKSNFSTPEANLSIKQKTNSPDDYSLAASDGLGQDHQNPTDCNDECICHAMAIPGTNFVMPKEPFVLSERIAFHFDEPVLNSLAPPYHPPKIS